MSLNSKTSKCYIIKAALFIILIVLCPYITNAQALVTGKILDTRGNLIIGASVKLIHNNSLIAFTITNSFGSFNIPITKLDSGNYYVEVSHIGYTGIKRDISFIPANINFVLFESNIELPTITIENKSPITKRGDTLNYDVKTFTSKNDRVIGDIIRKLPGIEVEANGQIKYNGKPITNYYIENLDLLEGRYNLANNNIPADMVDKVQVLENHQPVKALDSFAFSDKAAINIKLNSKAKNKVFTTAKLGIGVAPFLWDDELVGFNFRKGFQFISGYKTNNVGNNLQSEINSLTANQFDKLSFLNKKQDILFLVNPATPQFDEKKYLFNKSHLVYTNSLWVLNKVSQLKLNVSYLNNAFEKNTTATTIYYLPQDTVTINENQHQQIKNQQLLADLGLTINSKQYFLKNNLKIEGYWSKEKGLIEGATNTLQDLKNPLYQIINNFHLISVRGKKRVEFNSNSILKNLPQKLVISPGINADIFNQSVPYDLLTQFATQKTLGVDNYFAFRTHFFKFAQSLKAGINYQNNTITSNTFKTFNNAMQEVADSFKNNLHWQEIKPYAELSLTFIKKGYSFEFLSALQNLTLIRHDEIRDIKNSTNYIFSNNSLVLKKDLGPYYNLLVTASNETSVGSINQNTLGYILSTYRNISNNNFSLQLNKNYNTGISLNYRNAIKAMFGYLSLSYGFTKKNLLSSVLFINQLQSKESVLQNNNQKNLFLFYSFSKYFIKSKTSISFRGNFNQSSFVQLQQNLLSNITNKSNSATLSISNKKSNFIYPELNTTVSRFISIFNTKNQVNKTTPVTQFVENLSLNFFLTKNIIFSPSASGYFTSTQTSSTNKYLFLDAGFIYKKGKYNIEFKLLNISNIKYFKSINVSENLFSSTTYQIRGFNAILQFYLKL